MGNERAYRARCTALLLGMVLVATARGVDWPMFRFGPDHSGFTPDTSISKEAVSGSMVLKWTGKTTFDVLSSPAVVGGVVYTASGATPGTLYAFSAQGAASCPGTPPTCAPLWTGATGGEIDFSSPAVADGIVFVGSFDHKLYAFDAAGKSNCSGTPKTCVPLWTAMTGDVIESSPTVAGGIVYITSNDSRLYAFDAGGNSNCSGTPKTCKPLWTASLGSHGASTSPAVADGRVYVGASDHNLYVFDAAGNTNCAGTPRTCAPLWTAPGPAGLSSPAVWHGTVYIGSSADSLLYAFDAGGVTNCSGAPKVCGPLWTAATGTAYGIQSSPAVAGGAVYVLSTDGLLYAFDAAGVTNCAGAPSTCRPLWTGTAGYVDPTNRSSPAIANGLVYIGAYDHALGGVVRAFDAAGVAGCTGSPKSCTPLWTAVAGNSVSSSPAISNRTVYVGSGDERLYAFGLEDIPPSTAVVRPPNNTTVSGTATLAASASDDVSVSKVEFHMTGGSYHDALIGTAVPYYGWDYNWDTTTVPNGTYTLNSVAYDPAGNTGRSPDITITIRN